MSRTKVQAIIARKYNFQSWNEAMSNLESECCEYLYGEAELMYFIENKKETDWTYRVMLITVMILLLL